MPLSREQFADVVRNAVLIAIDLVLINEKNQVLLGYRNNAPAKGSWFVPGASIWKEESLPQALQRIAKRELGLDALPAPVELIGIYDHFHRDSFFDDAIPTHFVVMACRCRIPADLVFTPDDQHEALRFFDIAELLESPEVHEYTKNYFRPDAPNLFLKGPAVSH